MTGKVFKIWETLAATKTSTVYLDRKSTRLNSSHLVISYAVFCLKKKKKKKKRQEQKQIEKQKLFKTQN